MFPSNCAAILKKADENVSEQGQVSVDIQERKAEFTGPFVPLLRIDTKAKIMCIEDGQVTHVITGTVYLSSESLLRLVDIKCTLYPDAEQVLEIPTYLKAKIYKPVIKNGFLGRKKIVHKWDECTIVSISLTHTAIRASRIMCEYEEHLRLRIGAPIFSRDTDISLRLSENGLMFGRNSKYIYDISGLKEEEQTELADFIKLGSLELIKNLC